jgi:hypothetical protein
VIGPSFLVSAFVGSLAVRAGRTLIARILLIVGLALCHTALYLLAFWTLTPKVATVIKDLAHETNRALATGDLEWASRLALRQFAHLSSSLIWTERWKSSWRATRPWAGICVSCLPAPRPHSESWHRSHGSGRSNASKP